MIWTLGFLLVISGMILDNGDIIIIGVMFMLGDIIHDYIKWRIEI